LIKRHPEAGRRRYWNDRSRDIGGMGAGGAGMNRLKDAEI